MLVILSVFGREKGIILFILVSVRMSTDEAFAGVSDLFVCTMGGEARVV